MTNPMLDQNALEAALDAANELVCGAGKPVRDYVSGIIRAYLAVSSPIEVEPLIERLNMRAHPQSLSGGALFNPDGPKAAEAITTLQHQLAEAQQQVEALTRERDDAVARYAEATKEAGRLRDLAETRRLRQIWRYMNDDTYSRAEALAREVAELRVALGDLATEARSIGQHLVYNAPTKLFAAAIEQAEALLAAAKEDSSHG